MPKQKTAIRGISSVSLMAGAARMGQPNSAPTFRQALCRGAMLELVSPSNFSGGLGRDGESGMMVVYVF